MKISIYTFVRDGIQLDFHIVEMLRHHLPFADEIIVNEGFSSDDTYARIKDLDPKIKVFQEKWDQGDPKSWYRDFKDRTRRRCTGDWCILLDCDEFIPEWEFDTIRQKLSQTDKTVFGMRYLNFYGNYKVINANPGKFFWPSEKYTIHRNLDSIEVWGDGSNVRVRGTKGQVTEQEYYGAPFADVHHFGFVRHGARLREKWWLQRKRNEGSLVRWLPGFLFDLFPHKWDDPYFFSDLCLYDGPYMKTVLEQEQEFIRDDMQLSRRLKET